MLRRLTPTAGADWTGRVFGFSLTSRSLPVVSDGGPRLRGFLRAESFEVPLSPRVNTRRGQGTRAELVPLCAPRRTLQSVLLSRSGRLNPCGAPWLERHIFAARLCRCGRAGLGYGALATERSVAGSAWHGFASPATLYLERELLRRRPRIGDGGAPALGRSRVPVGRGLFFGVRAPLRGGGSHPAPSGQFSCPRVLLWFPPGAPPACPLVSSSFWTMRAAADARACRDRQGSHPFAAKRF